MPPRIMYIESKANGLNGPARIGRVTFSKSGRTIYYDGQQFQSLKGRGFKANYFDVATGEEYWISGCKKNGQDRLYGGSVAVDGDVREEFGVTSEADSTPKSAPKCPRMSHPVVSTFDIAKKIGSVGE